MEILVDEVYSEVKNKYSICQCEKYTKDIKSIALNNLPPVYFLSNVSEGEKEMPFYWNKIKERLPFLTNDY